jgi:hypothetical protein
MSDVMSEPLGGAGAVGIEDVEEERRSSLPVKTDPTDRPIPLWPEGALVVAAGVALLVIGLRHRAWIQRKVDEGQRMVAEFQRQGGMDDLSQVARQAADLFKGG